MVLWLREQPAEKWWWLETAGVDLHQLPTTGRGLAVNPVRKGLLCGLGWNTALFLERRHVLLKARSGSGHTNRGWFWKAGLIRQGQNQRLEEALGSNPERFAFFAVNRRLEGGGKNLGVVGCFHPLVRPHW